MLDWLPKFKGWALLALLVILNVYTLWYVGPGYFGDLGRIGGFSPLQEAGFYSGTEAASRLGELNADGRRTAYLAYLFDIPYMVMNALAMQGLIAFGIRHMKLQAGAFRLAYIFPIGFLIFDALEDSALALVLTSGSEAIGSAAGIFTALKFATFLPGMVLAIGLGLGGLIAWGMSLRTRGNRGRLD